MTSSRFKRKYQKFRELLISARKETGLTQEALALRLSKPQSYVSKYENGERRLDVVEFLTIAEVLSIDIPEFINNINS